MRYHIFLFLVLCANLLLVAQNEDNRDEFLKLNIGPSYNGTGDLYGYQYDFTYGKYLKGKRFFWDIALGSTTHNDEEIDYFFEDNEGNNLDGISRHIVSGIQLTGAIGYDFIPSNKHELLISVGPIVRYQVGSIPDIVITYFPEITDLPIPVQTTIFTEEFKTVAFGGVLKLGYCYTFKSNFLLGFTGGLQTDTNADTISFVTLAFGKRF